MIINVQQLTALLPLLIIILTALTVILSISYNRNHFFIVVLSICGFIFSFLSLYLLINILPIDINGLFYITNYSIIYIGMITFSSISVCIFGYSWLKDVLYNREEFYLLVIISHLGAISLILSNHMASLFVSIELVSLPIFGLISYSNDQKYSLESALKYMILSSVASSFLLLGIAWIYAISGNLSFISIIPLFSSVSNNDMLVLLFGISMILFSLLFKLSIVPFHLWTPDIYQGTPPVVLAFFSTVGKISIFFVLLNFLLHITYSNPIIYFILLFIIIFSILFGNLMAIFQNDIKRLFGYSSISQLGYLLIIFLVSNKNYLFSLETSAIYLSSYLFSNIAFFGIVYVVTNMYKNNNSDSIESYQGLFWYHPLLSMILTLVMLSLAGIPLTLGFISKFYILSIIIQEQLWIISLMFFVGTLLGLYSYLRIILTLYSKPSEVMKNHMKVSNYSMYNASGIIIFFSGIILFVLGVYPNELIHLIRLSIEL